MNFLSLDGTCIAILEVTARFVKAVKFGDTIRAVQKIVGKKETSKPDRGVLTTRITVLNQDDQTILKAGLVMLIYRGVRKDFDPNSNIDGTEPLL